MCLTAGCAPRRECFYRNVPSRPLRCTFAFTFEGKAVRVDTRRRPFSSRGRTSKIIDASERKVGATAPRQDTWGWTADSCILTTLDWALQDLLSAHAYRTDCSVTVLRVVSIPCLSCTKGRRHLHDTLKNERRLRLQKTVPQLARIRFSKLSNERFCVRLWKRARSVALRYTRMPFTTFRSGRRSPWPQSALGSEELDIIPVIPHSLGPRTTIKSVPRQEDVGVSSNKEKSE